MNHRLLTTACLSIVFAPIAFIRAAERTQAEGHASGPHSFSVRDYGATGDGATLDTTAINQALEACARVGGGQVLLPPGRYLSGTVHLRSHVTLFLDAGATLIGTTNLAQYQQPAVPSFMPEAKWGKWHRALILGENVEEVAIGGPGAYSLDAALGVALPAPATLLVGLVLVLVGAAVALATRAPAPREVQQAA